MKPSGPGGFYVRRLLAINSISLIDRRLFKFSISSTLEVCVFEGIDSFLLRWRIYGHKVIYSNLYCPFNISFIPDIDNLSSLFLIWSFWLEVHQFYFIFFQRITFDFIDFFFLLIFLLSILLISALYYSFCLLSALFALLKFKFNIFLSLFISPYSLPPICFFFLKFF